MEERARQPQHFGIQLTFDRFKQVLPHFFIVAPHAHQHPDFVGDDVTRAELPGNFVSGAVRAIAGRVA